MQRGKIKSNFTEEKPGRCHLNEVMKVTIISDVKHKKIMCHLIGCHEEHFCGIPTTDAWTESHDDKCKLKNSL